MNQRLGSLAQWLQCSIQGLEYLVCARPQRPWRSSKVTLHSWPSSVKRGNRLECGLTLQSVTIQTSQEQFSKYARHKNSWSSILIVFQSSLDCFDVWASLKEILDMSSWTTIIHIFAVKIQSKARLRKEMLNSKKTSRLDNAHCNQPHSSFVYLL